MPAIAVRRLILAAALVALAAPAPLLTRAADAERSSNSPTVLRSTYLGGSAFDFLEGIAIDASGDYYVSGVGTLDPVDFPTVNRIGPTPDDGPFVAKFRA